jgi:predicted HTH domain antitoxin
MILEGAIASPKFCSTGDRARSAIIKTSFVYYSLTMSLIISHELVQASGLSESELLQELVLLLFRQEKITLGSASRFLGMTQLEFQALLAEKNLCIHYDVNDLHEDVQNLQELGLL